MAGGYIFCEWNSVQQQHPRFQQAFAELESRILAKIGNGLAQPGEWGPKSFGKLTPGDGQYGRTTILPGMFYGHFGQNLLGTWRQPLVATGHQLLISGNPAAGWVIPEDFKVAWIGLFFPNKTQAISEIRFQVGDKKYGRINLEELESYNTPAIVFEEGYVLDEETSFDLWGFVTEAPNTIHIGMLGALYYRIIDKVLGNTGALVT